MASRAQTWQDLVKRGAIRSGAMLGAVGLGLGALILTLLLASYHPSDPSLNTAGGGPVRNLIGVPGAWFRRPPFADRTGCCLVRASRDRCSNAALAWGACHWMASARG